MTGPLDPLDFLTFSELAKGFPALKPRNTQSWLESRYMDALLAEQDALDLGSVRVPRLELAEVFQEINTGGLLLPQGFPARRSPA